MWGFAEIILTPLQASSVLIRADRRRASLVPPHPPITREQISRGELSSLLEEEDYNLSTMVSKFSKQRIHYHTSLPINFTIILVFTLSANYHAAHGIAFNLDFRMWVFMHHFLFDVRDFVKCPLLINFHKWALSSKVYVLISV